MKKTNQRIAHVAAIVLIGSQARAQEVKNVPASDPQVTQTVQINGSLDNQRRNDTTTKIVVSHADIVRYGDTNLADVLKRLPGVTVSGDVRMRGLGNGYTQILINGEPTAPGFSIDSISPDLIERVELLRSATVEFTTQAIAGTINLVLKKSVAKSQREIKVGSVTDGASTTPNLSLQLDDRLGNLSYSVTGVVKQSKVKEPSVIAITATGPNGQQNLKRDAHQQFDLTTNSFALTPRLNWTGRLATAIRSPLRVLSN